MSGRYWIKLWLEILQDRKMASLSDRLWRRFVELLLIAKAEDAGGVLPDLWWAGRQLGMTAEQLESDLVELAKDGLVEQKDGRWLIPNFAKRQDARGGAERQATSRAWRMSRSGHVGVTSRPPEEEVEGDSEGEERTEAEGAVAAVFALWEQTTGTINGTVADNLGDMIDEAEAHRAKLPIGTSGCVTTGSEWVSAAIEEAAKSSTGGRVSVKFVEAILARWMREGFKAPYKAKQGRPDPIDSWYAEGKHGQS